jgi:hypothetical protein
MSDAASNETDELYQATLIYGADGDVYMIPEEQLAAFRVSDAAATRLTEARVNLAEEIRADRENFPEVSGFSVSDPLEFPIILSGQFGRRPGGPNMIGPPVLHVHNMLRAPTTPQP